MAKRIFTSAAVSWTANAAGSAIGTPGTPSWMGVKGAAGTQITDILEVLFSGKATASIVAAIELARASTLETTPTTLSGSALGRSVALCYRRPGRAGGDLCCRGDRADTVEHGDRRQAQSGAQPIRRHHPLECGADPAMDDGRQHRSWRRDAACSTTRRLAALPASVTRTSSTRRTDVR